MNEAPRRPALRYHGGKWRLAPWIMSHFPSHECYVEPYGGAGSVLLQKRRSPLEVYNDLDGRVVSFFRVLREQPEELVRLIRLTPWARDEFELSYEVMKDDPVENARRLFVHSWQSIAGPTAQWRSGWRWQKRSQNLWKASAQSFTEVDYLYQVAERFRGVQIENDEALAVIGRCDAPGTLFYLDPPYLPSVRGKWRKKAYQHEMSDENHKRLAEVVQEAEGMFVISGYPSELYADLYEGWTLVKRKARVNNRD